MKKNLKPKIFKWKFRLHHSDDPKCSLPFDLEGFGINSDMAFYDALIQIGEVDFCLGHSFFREGENIDFLGNLLTGVQKKFYWTWYRSKKINGA